MKESKTLSATDKASQKHQISDAACQIADARPAASAQRVLQELANNSPRSQKATQLQAIATAHAAQWQQPVQRRENNTGLPNHLKSGIEMLSGFSMDDVRVHRNSAKPAQLQAHAYTQGTDIHLSPGQDAHLPHEAWHVVQQAQQRVRPTIQMKAGVGVNDDADLEREADVMGARASALALNETQQASPQTTSTAKALSGEAGVFQMRWINIENTNQSYWDARSLPTERHRAELARSGRVEVPYQYQAQPNAPSASRPHGLFLAAATAPPGAIGAPFPLPEPGDEEEMPQSARHEDVAWFHDGSRVQHAETRRPERTIHGNVSAREQLQQYGLPDYAGAAWAHTQPDHATPVDEEREDTAMRHPSTEQANQQHTVREFAQARVASRLGGIVASRHLQGAQPGRPGLYSAMEFGTSFVTGEDIRTHSDAVPYLTQQPGRYGDEDAHADMLGNFGVNALASWLRDEGVLDEEDVPDEFYRPPDGMDVESEDDASEGTSSDTEETTQSTPASENDEDAGAPVIVAALPNTLTLAQMAAHYNAGIIWARNLGTFSPEFGLFRANAVNTFAVLVQGGLSQAAATGYGNVLTLALAAMAQHYQQNLQAMPGYLPAPHQEWIFDQIDPLNGRSLWALLRYLNAAHPP